MFTHQIVLIKADGSRETVQEFASEAEAEIHLPTWRTYAVAGETYKIVEKKITPPPPP